MEYKAGLLAGMCVGLLVGLAVVAWLFKRKVLDTTFDERQERARGVAFRYGFFTLAGCVVLYGFTDTILGWRWCDTLAGCFLCVAAAMLVFAVLCIRKDAYLSLYERPKSVMALFGALAAVNLGLGGVYLAAGSLVEDGVLTFRAVNPIAGALLLVILAVYAVRYRRDRGGEPE